MITLQDIKNNEEFNALINHSCECLRAMSYTEHGLRHATYVSSMAGKILDALGHGAREVELARIAGYIHDVGNSVNRHYHGVSGALLVGPMLKSMGMPYGEVNIIVSAIGNHEEEIGTPVNAVSAALIIADKNDAHRARVRRGNYDPTDIHDRVNFSIIKNELDINKQEKTISTKLMMEPSATVMEYFKIYITRVQMTEAAAKLLGCDYHLYINNALITH